MNSIRGILQKIKGAFSGDIAVVFIVVLVGFSSFGLGRLSVIEEVKETVWVERGGEAVEAAVLTSDVKVEEGALVASKNSTVYHFPWCSGAKRIAEENKIWFASIDAAERAGYRPAKNCKGL